MSDPIISDCLAQIARIAHKYRADNDAIAGMRVSHLVAVQAHIEALEDRASQCTCDQHAGFEVIDRGGDGYRALEQARIDRLLFSEVTA